MKLRLTASVAFVALMLVGCSSTTTPPEETPSATPVEPHITLSVPETVNEGSTAEVVINSAGHDGEIVNLYRFAYGWDELPTCDDTKVAPIPVKLLGGPQPVPITLDTKKTGDIWFMLTSDTVTTECGQDGTRLRILANPHVAVNLQNFDRNGQEIVVKPGQITYNVQGWPTVDESFDVTATFIGPFKTAPEATATKPCPATPVAATKTVTVIAGTVNNQNEGVAKDNTVTLNEPGIYWVQSTVDATSKTFAVGPCGENDNGSASAYMINVK